jgi:hypothetical protein
MATQRLRCGHAASAPRSAVRHALGPRVKHRAAQCRCVGAACAVSTQGNAP